MDSNRVFIANWIIGFCILAFCLVHANVPRKCYFGVRRTKFSDSSLVWNHSSVTYSMLRYRKGDLYRLRHASGHLRPGDAVLGTLAAEGILQYRGKRAGRNLQRSIAIIDSTLNSDRRATRQRRRRRRAARPRGRSVNNLIQPQLMRH